MILPDFSSFLSNFIFTAIALYSALLLTRLEKKVDKQKFILFWLGLSMFFVLMPYIPAVFELFDYSAFVYPILIVYLGARYYWKLAFEKSIYFSLVYFATNIAAIVTLGFLFSGVFDVPS